MSAAFQGVSSVVSAVQGGPETIIDAQLRFLRAARQAGVRRFIPSDYSMNLFTVPQGDNVSSDDRREFARRADAPIEVATFGLSLGESDKILAGLTSERRIHRLVAGNGYFWESAQSRG